MRTFLKFLALAVLLWTGYWIGAAIFIDRGLNAWLDARRAEGWVADASAIDTKGYPFRFQTVLSDLELADPQSGVSWVMPEFRFEAASAKPHKIDVTWPVSQTLASPFERITIGAETMSGHIEFAPDTALALQHSQITLDEVTVLSSLDWQASLNTGRVTTDIAPDFGQDAHEVYFEAAGLSPSAPLKNQLDPTGLMPDQITLMRLVALIDFTAPWDRFAIERARPQIERINLEDLRAQWGEANLRVAGQLTVDGNGVPNGEITVKATNWRDILALVQSSGTIPDEIISTLERALEFLAGLSGTPNTLDAPLTFANGRISFGPIPLGPAPNFTIR